MTQKRIVFLDNLWGFMFALMAFDHSIHAYAQAWGSKWFYKDSMRTEFWDFFYVFDQAIIMPMIFFIAGYSVLGALERLGLRSYLANRFVRYGIPFVVGIPIFLPLLTYPRFHDFVSSEQDFWTYATEIFFQERAQAGPFWVMQALLTGTLMVVLLHQIFPKLFEGLGAWIRSNMFDFLWIFAFYSIVVFTTSDLLWGTPWWASLTRVVPEDWPIAQFFAQFFALQGSKFLMNFSYFILGAAIFKSQILQDQALLDRLKMHLPKLFGLMLLLGGAFSTYTNLWPDLSMSDLPYQVRMTPNSNWYEWLEVCISVLGGILPRTALLGLLVMAQVTFLLALFAKHYNQATPLWSSLAANAYGIFILHESMVVWMQYWGTNYDISPIIKPLLIFAIALPGAWALSSFLRERLHFKWLLG